MNFCSGQTDMEEGEEIVLELTVDSGMPICALEVPSSVGSGGRALRSRRLDGRPTEESSYRPILVRGSNQRSEELVPVPVSEE